MMPDQPEASDLDARLDAFIARLRQSARPVLLAGHGIRLAGAAAAFVQFAETLGIPVLTAWNASDLFPSEHPLYFGRPSTLGQRAANFIFQNADLLLTLGCRMNLRQIGYTFPSVARAACKVMVDIDTQEFEKPSITPDLPILCDAGVFMARVMERLACQPLPDKLNWLRWCAERRSRYPWHPVPLPAESSPVDAYVFSDILADCLAPDDVVVTERRCLRYPDPGDALHSGPAPSGEFRLRFDGVWITRCRGRVFRT